VAVAEAPPSQLRELLFIGTLLVAAVAAAMASLMSWRDYGRVVISNSAENGWTLPDGSLGRGWIAVALGVVLAAAGVLVAADRGRSGRVLATMGGVGLMVLAVLEWGLGAGQLRTGPGAGIWVLFVLGAAVVVAVGTLGAPRHDDAT
jgi:hypothetical protein